MTEIESLLRPNVLGLKPYSSARDEFSGNANAWLDANENPFDHKGLNRYPDPHQTKLKARISEVKKVSASNIFLGNGSDEAIDLLIRAFCRPGVDKVVTFSPTYGMYKVSAAINDVEVKEVPLNTDFQPAGDIGFIDDPKIKIVFLCSPNNPTGNLMDKEKVMELLKNFRGITVIDEAYIDFAKAESWKERLSEFPRLVVLQTLSKAYGLAGIRLGIACANAELIEILNRIKPPYNVSALTQSEALRQLENPRNVEMEVRSIWRERKKLSEALLSLPLFATIYPSDANFVFATSPRADDVYSFLLRKGVVIRNRSSIFDGALRITVGTPEENNQIIELLRTF